MSESQALLIRLQRQNAHIQGLLTPNLNQTANSELFAGRKFRVAARQMRALTADRPDFANHERIARLGAEVSHRYQSSEQVLHINPKMIQGNKTWDSVERVFHGAAQAKRETPAMAGELRQGSIISRMETFPQPGQSADDFRQQMQSTSRPRRTEEATKKVALAPKSRLFTKVEEISKPPSKPPSASVDEPDSPSFSLRSPPTIQSPSVQRQSELAELPASPTIEKGSELSDNPKPVSISKEEHVSFPVFESGKQGSSQTGMGQPSAPAIVSRKAETALPLQPKRDAPDVSANPVSPVIPGLPQHDRESKQPDVAAAFKQENSAGKATALQKPIEQTKEPAPGTPILQAKPVQRQLSKPLRAKLIQPKASESAWPILSPISPNVETPAPAGAVRVGAPSEPVSSHTVQRALSEDKEEVVRSTFAAPDLHGKDSLESPAAAATEISAPGRPSSSETPGKLLSEDEESAPETPILQAKPIQRQTSESVEAKLVQRQASEPIQAKPIQRQTSESVEAKLVLRQASEPVQLKSIQRQLFKPLQAKLVQSKPSEAVRPTQPTFLAQAKSPALSKLQFLHAVPLATEKHVLPNLSGLVQRAFAPSNLPEKSGPIQRAEIENLPAAPVTEPGKTGGGSFAHQIPIARSVDKPAVSAGGSHPVRKMPLIHKIDSHPRAENILRTIDSGQLPLKNIQPMMLQRQPSALVQPAKYRSVSMPKVLPDMAMLSRSSQPEMALPQVAASGATISANPNPMPLARTAEKSASSFVQLSAASPQPKSIEQPVSIGAGSDEVLSTAVQRTVADGTSQEQPGVFPGGNTNPEQPIDSPQGSTKPVDLNALAEEIFPIVKRLLAIEADRSGGGFR